MDTASDGKQDISTARIPETGRFWLLIITLWALNLADTWQTLYLKKSGNIIFS